MNAQPCAAIQAFAIEGRAAQLKPMKATGRGNHVVTFPLPKASFASVPRTVEPPLIYAVDDVPDLTKLYITLLEATGYSVRAFNDRAEALAALKVDSPKPDLLITDYLGDAMPVEGFMRHCLGVHPILRILMASGFSQTDVEFSQARPDRFIRKPFTPEEFRREVSAALAA